MTREISQIRNDRTLPAASLPASRSRLATWNYVTNLLFAVVTMAIGLFATPKLIEWLNDERYGASRMIVEYYGYLTLLELGLGGALSPLIARALGREDEQGLRATMAAGIRMYLRVTLTAIVAGLVLLPWITRMIPVAPQYEGDLRRAWLISLSGFLLLGLSPFRALVEANQRGYRVNLLLTFQSVFVVSLSLLLARSGWGITGQSLSAVLGALLVLAILAWAGGRRYPGLIRGLRGRPDPEAVRQLRKLSVPTLVLNLTGRISYLTDAIVVGYFLGPARVTMLFVTQRLAQLAQVQLQAVGSASWAGLAELHARGEHEVFNHRLIELTRVVSLLGVAGLAPIIAFNQQFVALWVGAGQDAGDLVTVVAAANAYLMALVSLWDWCFTGVGRAARVVWPQAAGALFNLGLSILLTWKLGLIVGPLLGTLASFLATRLWYLMVMLHRDFGTPLRSLAWAAFGPLAPGVPYIVFLWWIARLEPPRHMAVLAAEMALAALVGLLLGSALLLSPQDRALWRSRLLGALPGSRFPR